MDASNTRTYIYGADGYRHQSTVNGVTTDFVLDSSMVVRERRAGTNYATYFIGANGPMYRRDDTSGSVRWYLFDGLGSVLGEVDPSGNVTDFNRYDVYGALRGRTGTATTAHGFVGQLGHTSEAETGLIYMRARYMDPVVGRFISEDPARDGVNWYAYAGSGPTRWADRTGKNQEEFDVLMDWYYEVLAEAKILRTEGTQFMVVAEEWRVKKLGCTDPMSEQACELIAAENTELGYNALAASAVKFEFAEQIRSAAYMAAIFP